MYKKKLDRKLKLPHLPRWKRNRRTNKIWISKPQFKHFNDKIIINLYIYNRQYTLLYKRYLKYLYKYFKLKKREINLLKLNGYRWFYKYGKKNCTKYILLVRLIKLLENLPFLQKNLLYMKIKYPNNYFLKIKQNENSDIKNISIEMSQPINNFKIYKDLYKKFFYFFKYNKNILFNLKKPYDFKIIYIALYFYNFLLKLKYFREILLDVAYQKLIINRFKFHNKHLKSIKNMLKKIYIKNIEFNIVLLKTFYLDSTIFTQIIKSKFKYKKNKPLKILRTSIRKSKVIAINNKLLTLARGVEKKIFEKQNHIINNYIFKNNTDYIGNALKHELYNTSNIENTVLSSTKNKSIIGIKIKASGRITRRMVAQRSICNIKYKGTLKTIDSSYKGLSTVMLKGYEKSSLQYTHIYSKRRIGSYGLKGWINTN